MPSLPFCFELSCSGPFSRCLLKIVDWFYRFILAFISIFWHSLVMQISNCVTTMINHKFMSFSAVQIYDLSYIHLQMNIYSKSDQLPDGLIAQSVEHCTSIAEVKGSNPVQAWIFFLFCHFCNFNWLKSLIYPQGIFIHCTRMHHRWNGYICVLIPCCW